jgi:hypothetical protein
MADAKDLKDRIAELERLLKAVEADKRAVLAAIEADKRAVLAAIEADKRAALAAIEADKKAALEQQAIELEYEMFRDERRRMCHLFSHGGSCSTHRLRY